MLNLLKDCYKCFLLSLVKRYLNKLIVYYNLPFLIQKSFRNKSSLLHNLTCLSLSGPGFWIQVSISTFSEGLLKSLFLADFQC